jgi:hypothetical protein
VIKTFGVLVLLAMLAMSANASDWLEGGYVGSGNYGEIRQHFTDPIFYSNAGSYVSSDPAVRQMQESMERTSRLVPLGSMASRTKSSSVAVSTTPASIAGGWRFTLSEGRTVDMQLYQSGARIFGRGSITSGLGSQWVTASGEITGNSLILDLIPESGTEIYAISVDISRLHLPGSYTLFRSNAVPASGTLMASRISLTSRI